MNAEYNRKQQIAMVNAKKQTANTTLAVPSNLKN